MLEFAQQGKFDEVTVALALMCDLPVGHIERAIMHHQADHLIVLAKAIGLSWETTKAILSMHSPAKAAMTAKLEAHCASFAKLQPKSAISAMQFYRLRARAEASPKHTEQNRHFLRFAATRDLGRLFHFGIDVARKILGTAADRVDADPPHRPADVIGFERNVGDVGEFANVDGGVPAGASNPNHRSRS